MSVERHSIGTTPFRHERLGRNGPEMRRLANIHRNLIRHWAELWRAAVPDDLFGVAGDRDAFTHKAVLQGPPSALKSATEAASLARRMSENWSRAA